MISVIVPVYNCAPWLERCVRCVCAPPGEEVEILLIDDGSSDGSQEVARRLASEDGRIRLFASGRRGCGGARNVGLDNARGEWIFFLDADDVVSPDALTLLLEGVSRHGAQIASVMISEFEEDKEPCAGRGKGPGSQVVESGPEMARDILYQTAPTTNSANAKLFSRRLIGSFRFIERTLYEDIDFTVRLCLRAERVVAILVRSYFYMQRAGSIVHTFSRQRADVLKVVAGLLKEFEEAGDSGMADAARARLFGATCNILFLIHIQPADVRAQLCDLERRCLNDIPRLASQIAAPGRLRLKNRLTLRLVRLGLLPVLLRLAPLFYR